jgi:hypothetical protein
MTINKGLFPLDVCSVFRFVLPLAWRSLGDRHDWQTMGKPRPSQFIWQWMYNPAQQTAIDPCELCTRSRAVIGDKSRDRQVSMPVQGCTNCGMQKINRHFLALIHDVNSILNFSHVVSGITRLYFTFFESRLISREPTDWHASMEPMPCVTPFDVHSIPSFRIECAHWRLFDPIVWQEVSIPRRELVQSHSTRSSFSLRRPQLSDQWSGCNSPFGPNVSLQPMNTSLVKPQRSDLRMEMIWVMFNIYTSVDTIVK